MDCTGFIAKLLVFFWKKQKQKQKQLGPVGSILII